MFETNSYSKGISKDKHTCYKNWDESSSQMEADIISEGFKQAKEVHGLRLVRFIGDGDSSVHSILVVGVPDEAPASATDSPDEDLLVI